MRQRRSRVSLPTLSDVKALNGLNEEQKKVCETAWEGHGRCRKRSSREDENQSELLT